jgi:hypothetical protein
LRQRQIQPKKRIGFLANCSRGSRQEVGMLPPGSDASWSLACQLAMENAVVEIDE